MKLMRYVEKLAPLINLITFSIRCWEIHRIGVGKYQLTHATHQATSENYLRIVGRKSTLQLLTNHLNFWHVDPDMVLDGEHTFPKDIMKQIDEDRFMEAL